jgi:hypothetical protein
MYAGSTNGVDLANVVGYQCQVNQFRLTLTFVDNPDEPLLLETPPKYTIVGCLNGTWFDGNKAGDWEACF